MGGKFLAHFGREESFHPLSSRRGGTMMGLVELRFQPKSAIKRGTIRTRSTLSLT
jgi:hypothetical protein